MLSNYLTIGQIISAFAEEDCLTLGQPDLQKI